MNFSELFEINKDHEVKVEYYNDTKIFYIDNFYKRPREIVHWTMRQSVPLWKGDQTPSYNGINFFDHRHSIDIEELEPVYNYIQNLWRNASHDKNVFVTNLTKFVENNFNDYENNYWWPHRDKGQTAIIYLDEDEGDGTNLYEVITPDTEKRKEHETPWRPKKYWKLGKTLPSAYNRMVSFEADKIFHGAAISDDKFFKHYRLNQALFFDRI